MEIHELFDFLGISDVNPKSYLRSNISHDYIDFNHSTGVVSADTENGHIEIGREKTKQLFKSMLIHYYIERIKDEQR